MTVDSVALGFTLPSGPSSLCFDKEEFLKKEFEVDKFIVECRKRVPLEILRDDLDMYLKVVRSAVIELINKDYADFVNLSTNLVGMDKAICNLTTPLGQLKEEVLSVQTAMDQAIQAVQDKIKQQQEIQQKKAVLQRLINITQSVEKIEKLLRIQQDAPTISGSSQLTGPLIERVATEFNKLQFYVSRSKGHTLVDKVKPRIAAITTTLQHSLEGSFLSGLEAGSAGILRQCLRTYALIDKTQDAETLFREHVVRPYMEEIINEEFLRSNNGDVSVMYKEILNFVPERCALLNNTTRSSSGGEVVRGYDFVAKAVFPEVVSCLASRLSSLFAPGNPDVFHQNYTACMLFLNYMEKLCGSRASVKRLRHHPAYISLISRWSLPVYFQIRFQEIVGNFEKALTSAFSISTEKNGFYLNCSSAVWNSLSMCWDEKIYLPALTHKFLKVNLQIFARYKTWLLSMYHEEVTKSSDQPSENNKAGNGDQSVQHHSLLAPTETGQGDLGTGSSPPHLGEPTVLNAPITIGQVVALLADLNTLTDKVPELLEKFLRPHLNSIGFEDVDSVKAGLNEGLEALGECRPQFWKLVTDDVLKRCSIFLNQVNDIPRLYRRTNKDVPTKTSSYLSNVIKPLRSFCDEHSEALSDTQKQEFLLLVFNNLAQTFVEVTSEVLTSTKKMEDSLRRLKKARGGDKEKDKAGGVSDSDKIRTQIVIDIKAFLEQIESFGIKQDKVQGCDQLMDLVTKVQTDMEGS